LPCLLTGTGMAFPWRVLRKATLASGNIVEDIQLGLDLACAGFPPRLCPAARVQGVLPCGRAAAFRQRTRWEHGHLATLLTQVPRLLWQAVRRCQPALLGLALELSVPPQAILVLMVSGAGAAAGLRGQCGSAWLPAQLLLWGALAGVAALLVAWLWPCIASAIPG
jgi:cellulose synthase/poly-beta-1,6-N-acetylglucosamine synthase-like glycosyltransferase